MALAVLLHTSRVSAEATAERLSDLGIDARVIDEPNVFVRIVTGGNYRVRVAVPKEELERAHAELARWAAEAHPRVRLLAGEVQRVLLGATLGALLVLAAALLLGAREYALVWMGGTWLGLLALWVLRSRRATARGGDS
jgi:hypothetical protein